MAGWTNRGKAKVLELVFSGAAMPTNFYVALCTSAVAPGPDTNTLSQLTEIAPGNGYNAGGLQLSRNSTDFVPSEDDSGDVGKVTLKNLVYTASGGNLPASGNGARFAVLTSDEATVGNRQVYAYQDLGSDAVVSNGQPLTLQTFGLSLSES